MTHNPSELSDINIINATFRDVQIGDRIIPASGMEASIPIISTTRATINGLIPVRHIIYSKEVINLPPLEFIPPDTIFIVSGMIAKTMPHPQFYALDTGRRYESMDNRNKFAGLVRYSYE